MQALPIVCM